MTQLDEVLAEEWDDEIGGIVVIDETDSDGDEVRVELGRFSDETRAAVAVLGKRALALVLKHEFVNRPRHVNDGDGYFDTMECYECPECGHEQEHKPGCEWGALCEEARRLG